MIIRSGGIIAATWASLMHHGWDGYTEMTKKVVDAGNKVRSRCFVNEMLQHNLHSFISRAAIGKIEGINVLGDSKLCIVAFASDRFHVYKVADEMKVSNIHSLFIHIIHKKCFIQNYGWMLSCLQNPNAVQLYVVPNLLRDGLIDTFIQDLEKSTATVK